MGADSMVWLKNYEIFICLVHTLTFLSLCPIYNSSLTWLHGRPVISLDPNILKFHSSLSQDQPGEFSPALGVEVDELDFGRHDDG